MKNLKTKVAKLESFIDLLETELFSLNRLLIMCGFSEGIKSLKASANEFIKEKPYKK